MVMPMTIDYHYILLAVISMLPVVFMNFISFYPRFKWPKAVIILIYIVFIVFVSVTIGLVSEQRMFNPWSDAFGVLLTNLIIAVFLKLAVKGPFWQNFFINLMCGNLRECLLLFARTISTIIDGSNSALINDINLTVLVIILIIMLPITFFFCKYILWRLMEETSDLPVYRYMCTIPVAIFAIYQSIYFEYMFKKAVSGKTMLVLPIAWSVGIFAIYIVTFNMLLSTVKIKKLQEELHIAEIYTQTQHKKYDMIQDNIETLRMMRHNIRHLLLTFKGFLKEKEYDKIDEAIDQYINVRVMDEALNFCQDKGVDAIISYFKSNALMHQISVEINIQPDFKTGDSEIDFCIVLANLLENAYEACLRQPEGEKRFIRLRMGMIGEHMAAFSIENSCAGHVSESGGGYISSKDGEKGIGVVSVKSIVKKYNGKVMFKPGNDSFNVTVMMNTVKSVKK